MLTISNHKLANVDWKASPNHSGPILPSFIVMHYTATWKAGSAISTLTRPGSGVSAHLTIDTDGTVTQHVPFNVKAWHAGPSRHAGRSGLNSCSIGIEIANIGFLKKTGSGRYMDHTGQTFTEDDILRKGHELIECKHSRVGSGTYYWPTYTHAQLRALDEIVAALAAEYPILDVVSHEEIDTRGWKTDPGPAFPLERYKRLVQRRDDDRELWAVTCSKLNMRFGPGTKYPVAGQMSGGTKVEIFDEDGVWKKVGADHWVHGSYLSRVG